MTFAREFEAMPRVWGVGRVIVGGEVLRWEMSAADIEDETEVVAAHYRTLGLGDGDLVLVVALLSQAIHAVPLEQGAGRVGALYSSADATRFDAFRTASLIRQLSAKVVIGVDIDVVSGLDDLGRDLANVFGPVGAVVAADDSAYTRLAAAGLRPGRYLRLGPTCAVAPPGDDALTYDATRWEVNEDGGDLLLTNIVDRLTSCDDFRTGVRGTVPEPGRILLTP